MRQAHGWAADKPEFADLITGKCRGRTSRDQITFYRNVGNQGLQFSAVGGMSLRGRPSAGHGQGDPYRQVFTGYPGLRKPGGHHTEERMRISCSTRSSQELPGRFFHFLISQFSSATNFQTKIISSQDFRGIRDSQGTPV